MFVEYLNPPPSVDHQVPTFIAPGPAVSTEADHDIEVAHMDNNSFVEFPILEPSFEESSTQIYKEAFTESCWIKAVQEELNKFKRLKVWELVPHLDHVMIITLKWIYKVKLDEVGADTQMVEKSKLDEDPQEKAVDHTRYHGMIGTLMYLTSSRPDLIFDVCMSFANADHAGCQYTRKSMSGNMQLLGDRLSRVSVGRHFTKPLARERFDFLINKLGMTSMSPETMQQLADEEEE
nr:hypothetical protein [Tanacetum cinerariifolium]